MSLLRDGVDYVFEGELLPKHVAAAERLSGAGQGVLLGYTDIDPAAKVRHIRTYGHYPNNWASEYTDEQLLNIITRRLRSAAPCGMRARRSNYSTSTRHTTLHRRWSG